MKKIVTVFLILLIANSCSRDDDNPLVAPAPIVPDFYLKLEDGSNTIDFRDYKLASSGGNFGGWMSTTKDSIYYVIQTNIVCLGCNYEQELVNKKIYFDASQSPQAYIFYIYFGDKFGNNYTTINSNTNDLSITDISYFGIVKDPDVSNNNFYNVYHVRGTLDAEFTNERDTIRIKAEFFMPMVEKIR